MNSFVSLEKANKFVEGFHKSGKSCKLYCEELDLKISAFRYWQKRYQKNTKVSNSSHEHEFVKISQPPSSLQASATESVLDISYSNGIRFRWNGKVLSSDIKSLVLQLQNDILSC